jgi:UDP-2,3-diacylglucosamine pyrophosphatase LpxH
MNDAIIISDIHLGSNVCQSKNLIDFLQKIQSQEIPSKKLVINGDLFDSWDFRKLRKNQWKILSDIRKLSKILKVIWINGNHDGPSEIISHLIGVDFVSEYCFTSGDKKILIIHGDIFDNFISKYPRLTKIADNIYRFLQKIDKDFYWSRLAKRNSKTFLRCSEQICKRAKEYCFAKKCDIICCGHSHFATCDNSEKVHYYNSGCWTENPCSYLLIKNGIVEINYVQEIEK